MAFISLRFIAAIVLVLTFALFLIPMALTKPTANASPTSVLTHVHVIMLAEATQKSNQPRSETIKKYTAENFGVPDFKTLWYDNIIDVKVTVGTVTVKTNQSCGDKKIRNVCGVVSGFIYSHHNAQLGIRKVKIFGRSGEVLVLRRRVMEDCPP